MIYFEIKLICDSFTLLWKYFFFFERDGAFCLYKMGLKSLFYCIIFHNEISELNKLKSRLKKKKNKKNTKLF